MTRRAVNNVDLATIGLSHADRAVRRDRSIPVGEFFRPRIIVAWLDRSTAQPLTALASPNLWEARWIDGKGVTKRYVPPWSHRKPSGSAAAVYLLSLLFLTALRYRLRRSGATGWSNVNLGGQRARSS